MNNKVSSSGMVVSVDDGFSHRGDKIGHDRTIPFSDCNAQSLNFFSVSNRKRRSTQALQKLHTPSNKMTLLMVEKSLIVSLVGNSWLFSVASPTNSTRLNVRKLILCLARNVVVTKPSHHTWNNKKATQNQQYTIDNWKTVFCLFVVNSEHECS